jgi:hypothetical protein
MQKFNVKIRLITPYLQAKFGDDAKASLKVKAGNKAKVEDDETWKKLLYKDENGIYIPSNQIRESLVNGAKAIKKKPYGSFKEVAQSYFQIQPQKIYINKQEPDFINESYPSRADGMRVKLLHPAFNAGLEVGFVFIVISDDIDVSTLKLILEKAGNEKGIGAWRAGGNGRYETVLFEKTK